MLCRTSHSLVKPPLTIFPEDGVFRNWLMIDISFQSKILIVHFFFIPMSPNCSVEITNWRDNILTVFINFFKFQNWFLGYSSWLKIDLKNRKLKNQFFQIDQCTYVYTHFLVVMQCVLLVPTCSYNWKIWEFFQRPFEKLD